MMTPLQLANCTPVPLAAKDTLRKAKVFRTIQHFILCTHKILSTRRRGVETLLEVYQHTALVENRSSRIPSAWAA